MVIGVLALQGDFAEHVVMLRQAGVEAAEVRLPAHLDGLAGLIIPGGESTTLGKLAVRFGLIEPLRAFAHAGRPVWGTCAGAIFLAKEVGRAQPVLGLMDITIRRNAFGRQVDSFVTPLHMTGLEGEFDGIFIRAPLIESVGPGVEVLCQLPSGVIVAARQGALMATSFHPELTGDARVHALFASMCA